MKSFIAFLCNSVLNSGKKQFVDDTGIRNFGFYYLIKLNKIFFRRNHNSVFLLLLLEVIFVGKIQSIFHLSFCCLLSVALSHDFPIISIGIGSQRMFSCSLPLTFWINVRLEILCVEDKKKGNTIVCVFSIRIPCAHTNTFACSSVKVIYTHETW